MHSEIRALDTQYPPVYYDFNRDHITAYSNRLESATKEEDMQAFFKEYPHFLTQLLCRVMADGVYLNRD